MSIDLVSIILLLSLAQGLFLLFSILIKSSPPKHSKIFFCLLLAMLIWFQLEFLSIRLRYKFPFEFFYLTRFGGWLIIGPLFWFFTQSILKQSSFNWKNQNWLHFVPFVIFAICIPAITNYLVLTGRSRGYGMLTIFDSYNKDVTAIQFIYGLIFVAQFFHAMIYTTLSLHAVRSYEKRIAESLSSLDSKTLKWLKIFLFIVLGMLIAILIFIFYLFVLEVYRRQMDYFFVLPISILIYLFSYRAISSASLMEIPMKKKKDKYKKSKLSPGQSAIIIEKLQHHFHSEKPFLNADLRLSELAAKLDLSSHHLSQAINDRLQMNFYDFVNRHRVEQAKSLIEKNPEFTLLQIALDSGFNNKTSFGNAFKKHLGLTPTSFKNNHTQQNNNH